MATGKQKLEILNRFTNAVQVTAEIECAPDASYSIKLGLAVRWAVAANANLTNAYLAGANLAGANLAGANLTNANLANANLANANLAGAKGFKPERVAALASMRFMTAPIQAFKLVNKNNEGHVNGGVKYIVGETVEELDADCDPTSACAKGLNVADLPWVLREYCGGYRILLVQFDPSDIACVPTGTDGKFRVKRLSVVKDVTEEVLAAIADDKKPEQVAA